MIAGMLVDHTWSFDIVADGINATIPLNSVAPFVYEYLPPGNVSFVILDATGRGGNGGSGTLTAGGGGGGGGAYLWQMPLTILPGQKWYLYYVLAQGLTHLEIDIPVPFKTGNGRQTMRLVPGRNGSNAVGTTGGQGGASGIGKAGGAGGTNVAIHGATVSDMNNELLCSAGIGGAGSFAGGSRYYSQRIEKPEIDPTGVTTGVTAGGHHNYSPAINEFIVGLGGAGGFSVFGPGGSWDVSQNLPCSGAGGQGGMNGAGVAGGLAAMRVWFKL
jgi:hypothetical protein